MSRLIRYLRGSVRFRLTGAAPEQCLNALAAARLEFWDIEREDAVIIQRDVHVILLYKIDMETISTIDYPYKNRAIIIHPWNGIKEESL